MYSCANRPSAGRGTGSLSPFGSHSRTRPRPISSPVNQVPHGVAPPPQFVLVPLQIRYASRIAPVFEKWIALAPPPSGTSELATKIQLPSDRGNEPEPSGR